MEEDAVAETDLELTTRIVESDGEAMRDVIERHGGKVRGYLRKEFPSVAEDAFQETMMKLLQKAHQFDPAKGASGRG